MFCGQWSLDIIHRSRSVRVVLSCTPSATAMKACGSDCMCTGSPSTRLATSGHLSPRRSHFSELHRTLLKIQWCYAEAYPPSRPISCYLWSTLWSLEHWRTRHKSACILQTLLSTSMYTKGPNSIMPICLSVCIVCQDILGLGTERQMMLCTRYLPMPLNR